MSPLDELRASSLPRPDALSERQARMVMSGSALVRPAITYGLTVALLITLSVLGLAIAALRVEGTHAGDPVVILPLLAVVQLPVWWGFLRLTRARRAAIAQLVRDGELLEGAVVASGASKRSGVFRIDLGGTAIERFVVVPLSGTDGEATTLPVLVREDARDALCYGESGRVYLCKLQRRRRGYEGLPRANATRSGL